MHQMSPLLWVPLYFSMGFVMLTIYNMVYTNVATSTTSTDSNGLISTSNPSWMW